MRRTSAAQSNQGVGGALVILALLLATAAHATEFDAFDRRMQVRASDLIVTGRVASVHAAWNGNRSAILSTANITIDEVWKGRPAAGSLSVVTYGGSVDHIALEVEGAARFRDGEQVVLFLKDMNHSYTPLGMRFGKLTIAGTAGSSMALGDLPPRTRGEREFQPISVPLGAFRAEIERLVQEEVK
jgi:hypothetical protein